jgi:peptide-methionine (S)-S-oxide reductase
MIKRLVLICLAIGGASSGFAASDGGERTDPKTKARAIFAGGCFWCIEPPYDRLEGVISTTSGYIGGSVANPTYEQVSSGNTGHAEAVEVVYDPEKVSYDMLLKVFWRNIDPLDGGGQFCDRGSQYRSAIFYLDEAQKQSAEASVEALQSSKRFTDPVRTEVVMATEFYPAEEYHQNYYQENPLRYKYYRWGCGRDSRLEALWGDEAGGKRKQAEGGQ